MGSTSLIATSTGGVHHSAGNPDPAVTFRPRRFPRPRRLAPPPAFAGLFHPAATSRVCPPGVCPSPRSRAGFPRPCHALLPLSARACDQRTRPRLQGLAPRGECGAEDGGLGHRRSAPLLGFLLLRVLSPAHRGNASAFPPPTAFTAKNPSQLAPGVSAMRGLACLDSGCRPARAFWPEPPASFRKSGSRPAFQATHQAAGHEGRTEHRACHLPRDASPQNSAAAAPGCAHDLDDPVCESWGFAGGACGRLVDKALRPVRRALWIEFVLDS